MNEIWEIYVIVLAELIVDLSNKLAYCEYTCMLLIVVYIYYS